MKWMMFTLILVIFVVSCTSTPNNLISNNSISTYNNSQSYLACGCGCCPGIQNHSISCLYHSKGDDLNNIINQDKVMSQSDSCHAMGCSSGILYQYCD
jgi:hypothetical protein